MTKQEYEKYIDDYCDKIIESDISKEEYKIYKKVKLRIDLQDMEDELGVLLFNEDISKEDCNIVHDNIDLIMQKYEDHMICDSGWQEFLCEAIRSTIKEIKGETK